MAVRGMITQSVKGKRTRTYEAEDFVAVIGRHIGSLEELAAEEDPWTVAEMLRLAGELEAAAVRTVKRLRDTGYTWETIGTSLGISAGTAQVRYSRKIGA
jgi:hypothetical protein